MNESSKEYHARKSREWFERMKSDPEEYDTRNRRRTEARKAKKAKWVAMFGSACADCKGVFPNPVFEFHHVDKSSKHRDPAQMFMLSDERIASEMSKCVMLCANCHRLRHAEDGTHGRPKRAA